MKALAFALLLAAPAAAYQVDGADGFMPPASGYRTVDYFYRQLGEGLARNVGKPKDIRDAAPLRLKGCRRVESLTPKGEAAVEYLLIKEDRYAADVRLHRARKLLEMQKQVDEQLRLGMSNDDLKDFEIDVQNAGNRLEAAEKIADKLQATLLHSDGVTRRVYVKPGVDVRCAR